MAKTNIEEDIIKRLKSLSKALKQNFLERFILSKESREILANDIENILADRERLEKETLDLRDSNCLVKRYFRLKDNNKQLQIKANAYDSLVEKIKDKIEELKKHRDLSTYGFGKLEVLQELLDTEQIKKEV